MKISFHYVIVLLAIPLALGCGHAHKVDGPQGPVDVPAGVRVHIGSKEVKEGDRVGVFKSSCHERSNPNRGGNECHDNKLGEATVLRILDHDSAIVQPDAGLAMDESMKVEKIK